MGDTIRAKEGSATKRFTMTHQVGFADCDPARLVFYPRFFELFDRATERLFAAVGFPWSENFGRDGLAGLPLVDAGAKFISPVRFGDRLDIESWVSEWRNKTFIVRHDLRVGDTLAVEGREIRAWVVVDPSRPKGVRAVPIPDDVRARFKP